MNAGDGSMRLELDDIKDILKKRGLLEGGRAQKFVDSEVLRLCAPYVPFDMGILSESGAANTIFGSGNVIYNTPYARRWYYNPANFQGAPMRGNYWFERMKNNGGKAIILKELAALAGGEYK